MNIDVPDNVSVVFRMGQIRDPERKTIAGKPKKSPYVGLCQQLIESDVLQAHVVYGEFQHPNEEIWTRVEAALAAEPMDLFVAVNSGTSISKRGKEGVADLSERIENIIKSTQGLCPGVKIVIVPFHERTPDRLLFELSEQGFSTGKLISPKIERETPKIEASVGARNIVYAEMPMPGSRETLSGTKPQPRAEAPSV